MTPTTKIVLAFASAVLAAVVGWFGGGALRDATRPSYDTAIGIVDAEVGAPVEETSPTPEPTEPPTPEPTEEPIPTDTPRPTRASIICEGDPPDENCDCKLRDREWVWVCEIPTTTEPQEAEND